MTCNMSGQEGKTGLHIFICQGRYCRLVQLTCIICLYSYNIKIKNIFNTYLLYFNGYWCSIIFYKKTKF